jgi:hypothetical protein
MVFPDKNLQDLYIRDTYQDVLQKHVSGSSLFILDGTGTEIFHIPSASVGFEFGTETGLQTGSSYPITASVSQIAISASYANISQLAASSSYSLTSITSSVSNTSISASYSLISNNSISASFALSASYAPSSGTSLTTGSTYPITSSHALTASYILGGGGGSSESASYAQTASYSVSASHIIGYSGLLIPQYNQSILSYAAPYNQVSGVTYKWSGSIVAIIELDYSGSLFIGARRTF